MSAEQFGIQRTQKRQKLAENSAVFPGATRLRQIFVSGPVKCDVEGKLKWHSTIQRSKLFRIVKLCVDARQP
uniref:Uncharacterized protein n=1 Tax=Steinernema glaseri TaxID=37863 RepID=A0A1I8AUV1_9BILA